MGNSGSHNTAKSTLSQSVQHGGHSLPRGVGGASSASASQKQHNGGFKVLPERVPGQKLRMTDNGHVLHNGGTLSGRRLLGGEPEVPDADLAKLLKRRSEGGHHHVSGSRSDYDDHGGGHDRIPGIPPPSAHGMNKSAPPKRYHSDPDLLNSPGIISGNPDGFKHYSEAKKKQQQQHKSRAPPPPQSEVSASGKPDNYRKEAQSSPTKDGGGKRTFANFLKPSHKKSNSKQNLNNSRRSDYAGAASHPSSGDFSAKSKHASMSMPQNINGSNVEITSTKFDAKNKSTTYVLERREHYNSSSVLGGDMGGVGSAGISKNRASDTHKENSNLENRRFVKNGYNSSSDNRSSLLASPPSHSKLQAKLSDSSLLHSRSIDRSEVRNRACELQKRVRSMESLAHSDDRDINLNPVMSSSKNQLNEHYNRQLLATKDIPLENLKNPSRQLNNGWNGHLGRKPSNSSSVLSDNRRGISPNDKVALRHRYSGEDPPSFDKSSRLSAPLPASLENRYKDSSPKIINDDNFDGYFYGSSAKHGGGEGHQQRQRMSDSILGSLDKRGSKESKSRHQRMPSDGDIRNGNSRVGHDSKELLLPGDRYSANGPRHESHADNMNIGAGIKASSNSNLHRGAESHELFVQDLSHQNKGKVKPTMLDELLGQEPRKRDETKIAGKKDLPDRPEHVDEHLQETFFLKAKEPLNRIAEYSGRMVLPKVEQTKTKTSDGADLSEDEMDINMQLRPTLPKRHQAMPRFSPTQVWRSFSHDELGGGDNKLSDRSSDGEENDVFEDRIQRVARPMAPPRGNNEKSADSGISPGAGSPLPLLYDFDAVLVPEKGGPPSSAINSNHAVPIPSKQQGHHYLHDSHYTPPPPISPAMEGKHGADDHHNSLSNPLYEPPIRACPEEKKPVWTPEEDLASDFDAGSGDQQQHSPGVQSPPMWPTSFSGMISAQPKLISRKDMFNMRQGSKQDMEARLSAGPVVDGSLENRDSDQEDQQESLKVGRKMKTPTKTGEPSSPQKYNSVRKLKRSLSGVLQGNARLKASAAENARVNTSLDENWSLSRSLPNSLHNGHDGDKRDGAGKYSKNRANKVRADIKASQEQQRLPRSESGPVFVMSRQQSSELAPHRQPFTDLEGRSFHDERAQVTSVMMTPGGATAVKYNRGGHIVYLPKYDAMQIVAEDENDAHNLERRAYSDLGTGSNNDPGMGNQYNENGRYSNSHRHHYPFRKPKKFTYQSTVRQNERKQLEQKLSQEVAIKEYQRNREQELVKKVEEEFQKKRFKEKADIRQQLRILSLEANGDRSASKNYADIEHSSFEEEDGDDLNMSSLNIHPYHDIPSENHNERANLSLPPLLIPPEDYDMAMPQANQYSKRMGPNGHDGPHTNVNRIPHSMYHMHEPVVMMPPSESRRTSHQSMNVPQTSANSGGSGFFSGIGKWMRRQQRLEKNDGDGRCPSRQEPEGAPSSLGSRRVPSGYDVTGPGSSYQSMPERHQNGTTDPPSSPHQESRSLAIVGAKFSSGRNPENPLGLVGPLPKMGHGIQSPPGIQPHQRKSIYTHLQEVTEKEDRLRKQHTISGQESIPPEAMTSSVWISPNKSYVKSTPSSNAKFAFPGGRQGNGHEAERNGSDFYDMPYDSIGSGMTNGRASSNLQPSTKYDSQQYGKDKDISNRSYQNNSLQREWTAGQRHSIAIDTSRGQWGHSQGQSGNPMRDEGGRFGRGRENSLTSNNRSSQLSNGYSSGEGPHRPDVGRQNSYRELQDGSNLDYRRSYVEDQGLGPQQRSLSYSHIPEWEDGSRNNRKNDVASPRILISGVKPFKPNQVYRPVAFPTAGQQGTPNYN